MLIRPVDQAHSDAHEPQNSKQECRAAACFMEILLFLCGISYLLCLVLIALILWASSIKFAKSTNA